MIWRYNPKNFKYKLTESSEILTATVHTVNEFGVHDGIKYLSRLVKLDRSSHELKNMSVVRSPEFVEERLFLEVLIEGSAALYSYSDEKLRRYFYSTHEGHVEPLIYKSYRTESGQVAENNTFRQQLLSSLVCSDLSPKDFNGLKYFKKDLVDIFNAYAECKGEKLANSKKTEKRNFKEVFNLTVRPGVRFSYLTVESKPFRIPSHDYKSQISPRFGIEAEFILPFNKNKWSLSIDPNYQHFKGESIIFAKYTHDAQYLPENQYVTKVEFHSVQIPISLRHFFFLNDISKLYLNAIYIADFTFDSQWQAFRVNGNALTGPWILNANSPNLGVGLGYKYAKYSVEIQYHFGKDLFAKSVAWESNFSQASLIFGYTLF